jgi:hypothetical protein
VLDITYLQGDDCEECTRPDTLTEVVVTIVIKPKTPYQIPDGFWSKLSATIVDSAGSPVDLLGDKKQMVEVYSGYKPACPDCTVQAI